MATDCDGKHSPAGICVHLLYNLHWETCTESGTAATDKITTACWYEGTVERCVPPKYRKARLRPGQLHEEGVGVCEAKPQLP